MVSFPYYSHIFRDSYGSGMGIVWAPRGPIIGGPWKSNWEITFYGDDLWGMRSWNHLERFTLGPAKTNMCNIASWTGWWFFPTHLNNMLVKMGSSSPIFGVKIKKYVKPPPSWRINLLKTISKKTQVFPVAFKKKSSQHLGDILVETT